MANQRSQSFYPNGTEPVDALDQNGRRIKILDVIYAPYGYNGRWQKIRFKVTGKGYQELKSRDLTEDEIAYWTKRVLP